MQIVIDMLLANGWKPDGQTQQDLVRIPTTRSPVFGGIGGELKTFGGRKRFARGNKRVTVGQRVVCFYTFQDRKCFDFERVSTKDVSRIEELARESGGIR